MSVIFILLSPCNYSLVSFCLPLSFKVAHVLMILNTAFTFTSFSSCTGWHFFMCQSMRNKREMSEREEGGESADENCMANQL